MALQSINRKSPSKLIADLMVILFSNEELRNGSVTGKKSNFNKSSSDDSKPIKTKLNKTKIVALKSMIF